MRWLILFWLTFLLSVSPVSAYFSSVAIGEGRIELVNQLEDPYIKLLTDQREIKETVVNGSFEDGLAGWLTIGDVAGTSEERIGETETSPVSGTKMVRLGSPSIPRVQSRLLQALPNQAKSLKLSYLLTTYDHLPFDNPAFLIRINGVTLFQANPLLANPANLTENILKNSGWRNLELDLTKFDTPYLNLEFIVSNNGDGQRPTWVYLDNISTDFAIVPGNNLFTIESNYATAFYRLDFGEWVESLTFQVITAGEHIVEIKSSPLGPLISKTIKVDNQPPAKTEDLLIDWIGENYVYISWVSENTETPISSEILIQSDCSSAAQFNLTQARRYLDTVLYSGTGRVEHTKITGLNPDTDYCFTVTTTDIAGNASLVSNIIAAKTSASNVAIMPGDLIINELMWMGSSISPNDEWLELHNLTERPLDLTRLRFTKLGSAGEMNMGPDLGGISISSFGHLIISHYAGDQSSLGSQTDVVYPSLSLNNSTLQIKMFNGETLLDIAGTGNVPPAGIYDNAQSQRFSMQRAYGYQNVPELNWFTTLDPTTSQTYFDEGALERGTPKAANH